MEQLENKVERALKKERMKNQQERIASSQNMMSAEGLENVKRMMTMKAEKKDIERLYELKSNKIDVENVLDVQTIMSKQFKQMLVLFVEITNCQMLKANDTKQSLEKRLKNLSKQTSALSNWVLHFDPIDFLNSADAANIQVQDKMEESSFKDFTDQVLADLKRGNTSPGRSKLMNPAATHRAQIDQSK